MSRTKKWLSMVGAGNIDAICKQYLDAIEETKGGRKMDLNTCCKLVEEIKSHYMYDKGVLRVDAENFGRAFGFNGLTLSFKDFDMVVKTARDYGVFINRYKNSIVICDIQRVLDFFNLFESCDPILDVIYYRMEDVRFKSQYHQPYDDTEEDDDDEDEGEEIEDEDHMSPEKMINKIEGEEYHYGNR